MRWAILILLVLAFACSKAPEEQPLPAPTAPPVTATCNDGIRNQGEEGIDCGGPCPPCASCNDGIRNQGEEGIDCGGPCPPCASCNDGIRNQGEEGIDCGGPCPPCASCNDGIRNQGEEGIDCGGPCPPCLPQEYVLTASHEDALKQKLKLSTKAEFLVSSYPQGLSVGESHVFALGITNVMQEERKFMLELVFTNARDTNNNPITVDKQTILRWLDRNEFEDYTLEKYQQVFLPIGVTVGPEIAPGVPTVPGNYYFDVVLKYQRTQYTVDSYITLPFSFRVV